LTSFGSVAGILFGLPSAFGSAFSASGLAGVSSGYDSNVPSGFGSAG